MNWKRMLLKLALGIVIFVSLAGVVLGLSILFGILRKSPTENETPTSSVNISSGIVYKDRSKFNIDLFPYETDRYKIVFTEGKIVVYIYPNLLGEGTIEEQTEKIKQEAKAFLDQNGIDAESSNIEWRTK
uniref:Uncharacterized protein n=1 Tax=candidate division CPR3 bacterium TaxID=2268181 RepID=A0A7C5URF9_UNCC3